MSLATFHDLKGASVFITGGGSGIGATVTEGFMAQGAQVTFCDLIDATVLCDTLEARHGNRPHAVTLDVTDTKALQAAVHDCAARQGGLNVMVNNAANDKRHDAADVSEDFWDWSQAVNAKAYYFGCQAAYPHLRDAGGGAIVNFSSVSYMMGQERLSIYTAANAGVTGMTRSLAREWGGARIRVNAVMPGWVMTEKQKALWVTEENLAAHLDKQCLKEPLKPDDIVGGVLFLASDLSKAMTGQALVIDGGVVVTG